MSIRDMQVRSVASGWPVDPDRRRVDGALDIRPHAVDAVPVVQRHRLPARRQGGHRPRETQVGVFASGTYRLGALA